MTTAVLVPAFCSPAIKSRSHRFFAGFENGIPNEFLQHKPYGEGESNYYKNRLHTTKLT
jgi:hypothetical protein